MFVDKSRTKSLAKAYSVANRELRVRHAEEFHEILAEVYDQMGLVVRKRLTGDRKRKADIESLKDRLASLEGSAQPE